MKIYYINSCVTRVISCITYVLFARTNLLLIYFRQCGIKYIINLKRYLLLLAWKPFNYLQILVPNLVSIFIRWVSTIVFRSIYIDEVSSFLFAYDEFSRVQDTILWVSSKFSSQKNWKSLVLNSSQLVAYSEYFNVDFDFNC